METIIKELLSLGIVSAAVVYLAKKIAEQLFSRDIEKFKSDLEKRAFEHQIIFQTLHEKRTLIIADLYKKFAISFRRFYEYFCPVGFDGVGKDDKQKTAFVALEDFKSHFFENEIYLSSESSILIFKYIDEIHRLSNDFKRRETNCDKWDQVWSKFEKEVVNKIKADLQNEFRKYLGVSE